MPRIWSAEIIYFKCDERDLKKKCLEMTRNASKY